MKSINKRTIKGTVVSDKMDKTIVVAVHSYKTHPKYHKRYRVTKKFFVHDQSNKAKLGDKVMIQESRPLSRHKRWTLKEIISSASPAALEPLVE